MADEIVEFNPLSLESLGLSVVDRLMKQPVHPLAPDESFLGSGIYALYYAGDQAPYESMPTYVHADDLRFDRPIYVGKAVPKGSRKGGIQFDAGAERSIYSRLRQHARSIDRADNLMLGEFRCRFLVVAPVWIQLAENLIISEYEPVWNAVVDGFGNHDPGKGRYDQEKSRWDSLHPGRPWAERLQIPTSFSVGDVMQEVRAFLEPDG